MNKTQSKVLGTTSRAVAAFLLSISAAHADVVSDWNRIAVETVSAQEKDPSRAARSLATVHIALFEAMNWAEGAYVPRFLVRPPQTGMSGTVLASAAAHHVLTELYPARKAALDQALRQAVTAVAGQQSQAAALITGRELGNIVRVVRRSVLELSEGSPQGDSMQDALAWSSAIGWHAAASRLQPLESARLFAQAALAVDQAYEIAHRVMVDYGIQHPCVSCTVASAVQTILAAQPAPQRAVEVASIGAIALPAPRRADPDADASGLKIGREALNQYPRYK